MARVLPHFFAQYKINDRLTAGVGVYTPYGLILTIKTHGQVAITVSYPN